MMDRFVAQSKSAKSTANIKCPMCDGKDFEDVVLLAHGSHQVRWLRPGWNLLGLFSKMVKCYRCKDCGFLAQFGKE
jgi:hypothetical protein